MKIEDGVGKGKLVNVIPEVKFKVESFKIEARERAISPGWHIDRDEHGDYTMWYEDPDFLKDEDVLI